MLGILAVNIAAFAGPMAALNSPHFLRPAGPVDQAAFAFTFLVFEGKMRALFALLFGAGLALFWERAEARGRDGDVLQLRRLCWLMPLGMLHYFLLWWGDILFLLAVCGVGALLLRPLGDRALLAIALGLYFAWNASGLLDAAALVQAETAMREGTANAAQARQVEQWLADTRAWAAQEAREARLGFWDLLLAKLRERPFWQLRMVANSFGEILPLMLIGIVLQRQGMFSGTVPRARLVAGGAAGVLLGLSLTAMVLAWAWPRGFPPIAMHTALVSGMALPHLLCGCGYAVLLAAASPRWAKTGRGRRLVSAGRMAFSNYILASLVMTCAFYGWGLGLFGTIGPAAQWLFVIAGWALMLAWSEPWLRRFRRGPLEWLWRSLVERRPLPNRG